MRRDFRNFRAVSLAAAAGLVAGTFVLAGGQERGGLGGVREQDEAATRTAAQLNPSAQQNAAIGPSQASSTDLLFRAGIIIDARNPNRMIIERVIPNSPAFMAGLVPGDVITRVNGSPVTSLTAVAQALLSGAGNALGLQVDRNGQSRQLNLNFPDNSARTAMRTDFGAPLLPNGQSNQATATVGGVPVTGAAAAATTPTGVAPGLGTTTAQSAGGRAVAAGQPTGVGQGTATVPGRAVQGTSQGTMQGTTAIQPTGATSAVTGQLPTTTTANTPIVPGNPNPSLPGNPNSPSQSLPGAPTALPGIPAALPGVQTAIPSQAPASIPSSQGTVNPSIGGGTSPATGAGTVAPSNVSSQGGVNPSVGGGTTSPTSGAGAIGSVGTGTTGATGTGVSGGTGATASGAAGASGTSGAGAGGGTSGGAGGAGGGAAGGT